MAAEQLRAGEEGATPDAMRICVFCGSRPGVRESYREAAVELGRLMAQAQIGLVYGGASLGLMGAVADSVLAYGGEVIGVIPEKLMTREVAHHGLADLRVVGTMHERKALMAELADAFVALPGGIGTLEELFEVWTWSQLGLHDKPCALLNTAGFYGQLSAFLDFVVAEGFLRVEQRAALWLEDEPTALLARIRQGRQ
ncbi:MAG: hypothetical protein JWN48_1016 [Myxococcaceae bacterium]|nr:hypothetical protein [Myxococcaceae bacterium]